LGGERGDLIRGGDHATQGEDASVAYTVTTDAGKSRQHRACDTLLADIKRGLEAVRVVVVVVVQFPVLR
jgi:hypothetical protein